MNYSESPEKLYFRERTQREKPLSSQEEVLWSRFMPKYLKQKIKPEEFLGFYPQNVIEADKKRLQEKKAQPWYKEAHARSKLLEALLWYNIEQQNWLGDDVYTIVTSEPDENLRGFDFILEVGESDNPSRLGVDVVLANRPEEIYKKWDENVFAAWLAAKRSDALLVRYFHSEVDPKFKHWIQVPRVVIGLDSVHYNALVSALVGSDQKDVILQEVRNLLIKEINLQINQLLELPPDLKEKFKRDLLGIKKAIQPLLSGQKQFFWEDRHGMDMVFWALRNCVSDKESFDDISRGKYIPEKRT